MRCPIGATVTRVGGPVNPKKSSELLKKKGKGDGKGKAAKAEAPSLSFIVTDESGRCKLTLTDVKRLDEHTLGAQCKEHGPVLMASIVWSKEAGL